MNDTEFRQLVREMRKAQKDYFRNRLQSDLYKCKDLERRVDQELSAGPEKPAGPVQESLFGDEQ
jgi:hypothetical protein